MRNCCLYLCSEIENEIIMEESCLCLAFCRFFFSFNLRFILVPILQKQCQRDVFISGCIIMNFLIDGLGRKLFKKNKMLGLDWWFELCCKRAWFWDRFSSSKKLCQIKLKLIPPTEFSARWEQGAVFNIQTGLFVSFLINCVILMFLLFIYRFTKYSFFFLQFDMDGEMFFLMIFLVWVISKEMLPGT